LPAAFSRLHPRYGTPQVSLLAQAAAASFAILLSFVGSNVKVREAYTTLVALTVFTNLVPFVYLYLSLLKVAGAPGGSYRSRAWLRLTGALGLLATLLALATTFVPSAEIKSIGWFELKLLIGLGVFVGLAAGWFRSVAPRRQAFSRLPAD